MNVLLVCSKVLNLNIWLFTLHDSSSPQPASQYTGFLCNFFLSFSFFFFATLQVIWDLTSPIRDRTCAPCNGSNLNHWTYRAILYLAFSKVSKKPNSKSDQGFYFTTAPINWKKKKKYNFEKYKDINRYNKLLPKGQ